MKLRYTPQARDDLRAIREYIRSELCNPSAAARVTDSLVKSISKLKDNPYMGGEIAKKFDVETDMRFLVSSDRIAFYRVEGDTVSVIRIIDGRTDYMNVLLSE